MITLRTYQDTAVAGIREAFNVHGHRRVLFVLPTGGGKTVILTYITQRQAAAGQVVWIIAHRDELLRQISAALMKFDVPHGIIRGGSATSWHDVQVCSVQTLVRRQHLMPKPDFIIFDECHHAASASYVKIIEANPDTRILGVTATPVRGDDRGLGDYFEIMVLGPTPQELTDAGYLAPAVVYAPELIDTAGMRTRMGDYRKEDLAEAADKPQICGAAVEYYQKYAAGKRCIVFCVNLRHTEHTLAAYTAARIPAAILDGNMTTAERTQVNLEFFELRILVLITCEIANEGYDVPGCDAVQLLRPTQSTGLFLQQVGRCLRPALGKDEAIILDHVGNCGRMSNGQFVPRHGLPTDERNWELTKGKVKRNASPEAPGIRTCYECYCIYSIRLRICPKCGIVAPVVENVPETVDGQLHRITGATQAVKPPPFVPPTPAEKERLLKSAVTLKEWHQVAKRLGKSSDWAFGEHSKRFRQVVRSIAAAVPQRTTPAPPAHSTSVSSENQ